MMMSTAGTSAFVAIRYSAMLSFTYRPRSSSSSVASNSADAMPQIMPPRYCDRAVRGFMMWPAANAPVMRGTRISRVRAWTRTSTISAPNANIVLSSPAPPPIGTAPS